VSQQATGYVAGVDSFHAVHHGQAVTRNASAGVAMEGLGGKQCTVIGCGIQRDVNARAFQRGAMSIWKSIGSINALFSLISIPQRLQLFSKSSTFPKKVALNGLKAWPVSCLTRPYSRYSLTVFPAALASSAVPCVNLV
jgi:hypothetical protein